MRWFTKNNQTGEQWVEVGDTKVSLPTGEYQLYVPIDNGDVTYYVLPAAVMSLFPAIENKTKIMFTDGSYIIVNRSFIDLIHSM